MSKLAALKKQIAALEAQAERIAKEEMSSAVAKVKEIMAEFNLTIEHLTQTGVGKRTAKKTKAKVASVAKYADPKTGKTWSGVGRAPGWIAGAKSRDTFLVGRSATSETTTEARPAVKKAPARAAKKASKPAAKKAVASAKRASKARVASVAVKARPSGKKPSAKKSAPKAAASKRAAVAQADPTAAPSA